HLSGAWPELRFVRAAGRRVGGLPRVDDVVDQLGPLLQLGVPERHGPVPERPAIIRSTVEGPAVPGPPCYGGGVDVEVTPLPGIGTRQDFVSRGGRRIGVVTTRDGKVELIVSRQDDPDSCVASIPLTGDESATLA